MKSLTQIHVRGSSNKEQINQKDLEILFILHYDKLYRLSMFEPSSGRKPEFKHAFDVSGL